MGKSSLHKIIQNKLLKFTYWGWKKEINGFFFSIEKTHLHSHINNLLNNLAPIFCVIAPFKHVRGSKACCGIIFLALNLLKVLCFYLICNTILFVFHLCKVICTELNNLFSFKYFYLKFLCNKTNPMCISSLMTV